MRKRMFMLPSVALLAVAASGCFSPAKKTERSTAIEQQLVAEALERAIARLNLSERPVPGTYRVIVTAPKDVDTGPVRAFLESRLYDEGLQVTRHEDARVPTIEARVEYAGSELEYSLIGVPLFIPGIPVAFGDISLYKSSTQRGRARLGLSIWDSNGNLERQLPHADGTTYFRNYSFLTFIGDFIATDMDEFASPGAEKEEETEEEASSE